MSSRKRTKRAPLDRTDVIGRSGFRGAYWWATTKRFPDLNEEARPAACPRARLPDRRPSITFTFEVGGLAYIATVSRFSDGRIGELLLNNHRSNSGADTSARDAAITFSIAVQHGADPEAVRLALCRDSNGKANGPLGTALDLIFGQER